MDPGLKTPLLDLFRRGDVDAEVRMLAARGALAPRAHEQLALLVLLVDDRDFDIREAAEETLARIPRPPLAAFLARSDVASDLKEFFRARGTEPADAPARSAEAPLFETDDTPAAEPAILQAARHGVPQLALLTVGERIMAAMKGSREVRSILIRDPNKLVASAVLSSPKLTESEVESFARMANVSEEVLRIIGTARTWVSNYGVASGLTRNPKTPLGISMGLVNRLTDRDVKLLAIDRNVPEALRIAARKRVGNAGGRR